MVELRYELENNWIGFVNHSQIRTFAPVSDPQFLHRYECWGWQCRDRRGNRDGSERLGTVSIRHG